MNLVVISGKIGHIEMVSQREDGASLVDGFLIKTYNLDGNELNRKYFFSIAGKKATEIYNTYKAGDNVVINGKLASKIDENGIIWLNILVSSMAKLESDELF